MAKFWVMEVQAPLTLLFSSQTDLSTKAVNDFILQRLLPGAVKQEERAGLHITYSDHENTSMFAMEGHSCSPGRNARWCSYCGKQSSRSSLS